ncbi:hypothetical protein ACQ2H7_004085 [Candidozyma auris]
MSPEPDVWPPFQAPKIIRSSSQDANKECPYVLSKKVLGTGSYSKVYECRNTKTGAHYAAKQYEKRLIYGMESSLQSEFQILKQVSFGHKNILSLIDYFETQNHLYLVTDLALGGDLFDKICESREGKLSVRDTRDVLSAVLSGLSYLHSHKIVHRDIKAENIVFASSSSKPSSLLLADFGLAVLVKDNYYQVHEQGGTLSYMAPECFLSCACSFPVDMWAVGVLTYYMLCGYMPFDCDSDEETKDLISKADFIFEPTEYWEGVPESAKDFITNCFILDPENRITASEALNHPFPSKYAIPNELNATYPGPQQGVIGAVKALIEQSSFLEKSRMAFIPSEKNKATFII